MISLDEDKQAIVMGLGRFGGGLGASRYLLGRGMRVIVTDTASETELSEPIAALREEFPSDRITFVLDGHEKVSIDDCDMLVVNPAVPQPWNNTFLHEATEAGLLICTEIELLLDRLSEIGQNQLIAVTGSAGKSTTCSMIAHLARRSGRACLLGGNIGGSLLNHSDADLLDADAIVLELSSFMLHWIGQGLVNFEPEVGVLTSLDENHIDWHGSMEHYIASKSMIRDSKQFIPPIHDHGISQSVNALESDSGVEPWWRSSKDDWVHETRDMILKEVRTPLPGGHQKENAATACVALSALLSTGARNRSDFARSLAPLVIDFEGLEHRLRPLGMTSGILVIDDSKSTTPGATKRAIEAFDDASKIHLIAGGFDKGADLSPIASMGTKLGGLYGVGQTGHLISMGGTGIDCHTIEKAVQEAGKRMENGDVLLLSPGCASWDQFSNYQERGKAFRRSVETSLGSFE
ncbi:MAG: UDP-N-acetylmuramoyl-L-alanine--D-glutamate ligase [Phycisphaerae bacterium]|nr:UDP-N-acetylmuramoyl-L-alanine--D-glutamate ligase [Phycisphaerae bacterium]